MKKKLVANSLSGIMQVILTMILMLICIPVFITKLGMERYGVLSIVSVIGSLSIVANLGLNNALIVFLGKQGKCQQSDHDLITVQIIMGIIVLFLTLLAIIFVDLFLYKILSIPEIYIEEAKKLYFYLLLSNALVLMGQSYVAVLEANQHISITNVIQFLYNLVYWGGMLFVVSIGKDLEAVGVVILIASALWFGLILYFAQKSWGRCDFSGLKYNFYPTAKKQLSFGVKIYSAGLISFLFEPLSKILLSHFSGVSVVGIFEIALKVKMNIHTLFSKALYPLFPYINQEKEISKANQTTILVTQILHFIVIVLSYLILALFPTLLNLWLNDNYNQTIALFVITITIAHILFSPTVLIIYWYLMSKGQPSKIIYFFLSAVVVNTIIFVLGISFWGDLTILISFSLAMLASYITGIKFGKKYIDGFAIFDINYYCHLLFTFIFVCWPVVLLLFIQTEASFITIGFSLLYLIFSCFFLLKSTWMQTKLGLNINSLLLLIQNKK